MEGPLQNHEVKMGLTRRTEYEVRRALKAHTASGDRGESADRTVFEGRMVFEDRRMSDHHRMYHSRPLNRPWNRTYFASTVCVSCSFLHSTNS